MTRAETERVRKIIRGALDAANELMTEFVSKKRAADWAVLNEGLYNAETFLRETERRKA